MALTISLFCSSKKSSFKKSPIEDVILDTWDDGSSADLSPMVAAVTSSNVNGQTSENKWTPLMVVCGLNTKGIKDAMEKLHAKGGERTTKTRSEATINEQRFALLAK